MRKNTVHFDLLNEVMSVNYARQGELLNSSCFLSFKFNIF